MATKSVSVRIPEESLKELERIATLKGQKVSDLVRDLIVERLTNGTGGQSASNRVPGRVRERTSWNTQRGSKKPILCGVNDELCHGLTKPDDRRQSNREGRKRGTDEQVQQCLNAGGK